MKRLLLVLIALFAVACSTPRPAQQPDKVRSGEDTAKTAADAARKAEADKDTGLLVSSSEDAEPAETQPTTMPTEPKPDLSDMTPTLRVTFVKGTLTQSGEPISNFEQVCKDAVAANADVVLIIEADPTTKHEKVVEAIDTAKTAGVQKFSLETAPVKQPESKEDPPKDEGKDSK